MTPRPRNPKPKPRPLGTDGSVVLPPAVVEKGAFAVWVAPEAAVGGEVVKVETPPGCTLIGKSARFVAADAEDQPVGYLLEPGDKLLVPVYDEAGEVLLGHSVIELDVVIEPRTRVSRLEADPQRPNATDDDLTAVAKVHDLRKTPSKQGDSTS